MNAKKIGKNFPKHIRCIDEVIFTDGGYFDGYKKTTVHFSGDQAILKAETMNPPSESGLVYTREMPKHMFLYRIMGLHIGGWNREYINPEVLDGEQWELEIHFFDGHKPVKIYGSNAYPPYFNELQHLMTVPPKRKKNPFTKKVDKFVQEHHIQTLGGLNLYQEEFSCFEWSAPVIQQPSLLTEYVHLIGLIGAKIIDVNVIDDPGIPVIPGRASLWQFDWNNELVLITDRGNFEIEYNESSSVRISKDCIPKKFYFLDKLEDGELDLKPLFAYLKNDRIVDITTKSQTYYEADDEFTGSCGIYLEEDFPAYIKEFRLLLESGRQIAFTSIYDDGIISLYDKNNQLVRLD